MTPPLTPIKTLPSDRTPCSHRAGSRHLSLEFSFPLLLVSNGQEREEGGGEKISSFYCEHNFLTNSFHESPGDLCLFIYLAAVSFLKPRLMSVLKVRTDPAVAGRVALHAFQLSCVLPEIFLDSLI